MTKNELEKAKTTAVATMAVNKMPEGLEEMDASDIVIPRAKLLQGSSDQIKNPDAFPNLKVGMVVNSVDFSPLETSEDNDKVYPFIPVKMFKSWCKFKEDMTLDVKTYDKNHPLALGEDAWEYKQLNFLGFQPKNKKPIIFTFWKTSYKAGQDIVNIAQMRQKPLFSNLFYISTKTESKDKQDYKVFTVTFKGETDKEIQAIGSAMYEQFNPILSLMKSSNVVIADESFEEKKDNDKAPWEE